MYGDLFLLKFWKRLHFPTLGKKCLCHGKINTVVPSRKNQFSKGCGWRFLNLGLILGPKDNFSLDSICKKVNIP
jgi:hypothetical protein